MAELGIYDACKIGNHLRRIVREVEVPEAPTSGGRSVKLAGTIAWTHYRTETISYQGCARAACTCTCHLIDLAYRENGHFRSGTYNNRHKTQVEVIEREIAGFLEPDDAPGTYEERA